MKPSKISPVANPPQFVVLGCDDNTKAEAIDWISGVLEKNKNYDGSKMYMSFYVNTDQSIAVWDYNKELVNAAYNAYKAGHEVSNHTSTHLFCVTINEKKIELPVIKEKIQRAEDLLIAAGIPKEHHFGFRTPFLRYSENVFQAVKEFGFLYDCSICAAYDNKAGDNYFPYTLDGEPDENGNYSPDNNAERNYWGEISIVGKQDGLWELPCTRFALAAQDIADAEKTLKRKYGDDYQIDGYVMGLDWNLWNDAELNGEQTVRTLMNTLNESMKGNRAPFTAGVHSQFYFEPKNVDFPNISPHERRKALEEFIKQASKIKDVFFVSGDMVIRWMQNPVSASEFNPENYRRDPYPNKTAPSKINLSNNSVNQGVSEIGELTAVNLNADITHNFSIIKGDDIYELSGNKLKFKSVQNPNLQGYNVCIKAQSNEGNGSIEQNFNIFVTKYYDTKIEFIGNDTASWIKKADNMGSNVIITNVIPLCASLDLTERQTNDDGSWTLPFSYVYKNYKHNFAGLRSIEIDYSSDSDFNFGIGYCEKNANNDAALLEFKYTATLSAAADRKIITITPDMFEMSQFFAFDEANKKRMPLSLTDALLFKNLHVSFLGVDEGKTVNIKVFSLKLIGIPD